MMLSPLALYSLSVHSLSLRERAGVRVEKVRGVSVTGCVRVRVIRY
jgi:hypothetical protein